jgi:cobalt-zinc-cadmium efflux system protein
MLALAVIGVLVNGAAAFRTSKASSINERTVSLHLLEDVLGWAAVLIGSLIMRFTGLTFIDPILSVAIACFVLVNVFKNIRQVLPILLQGVPPDIDSAHIADTIMRRDGISGVHDLHIWSLDEEYNVLTVHAVLKEALPAEALVSLKRELRTILKEEGVQHATIEFEMPGEDCGLTGCV